jgi:hypothetical protein
LDARYELDSRYKSDQRGNAPMADDKREERAERPAVTPQDRPGPHHVADEPVGDADALGKTVRSPTTETGLPVEEQIQKEWDPKKDGGLPTPLRDEER